MVDVVLYKKNEFIYRFKVEGHSGYAESGKDIVCAGISAIVQTAVMGLNQFCGEDFVDMDIKDGNMDCILQYDKLGSAELEKSNIIIKTMLLGLKSIEENYKKYLKVVENEEV
jgi:hypothetical protein